VLEAVEEVARPGDPLGDGEITATSLLERFGFTGDRLDARSATCPAASGGGSSCCGC
jgi:hypothetical protein